jgi:hypothetical protein
VPPLTIRREMSKELLKRTVELEFKEILELDSAIIDHYFSKREMMELLVRVSDNGTVAEYIVAEHTKTLARLETIFAKLHLSKFGEGTTHQTLSEVYEKNFAANI